MTTKKKVKTKGQEKENDKEEKGKEEERISKITYREEGRPEAET